MTGVFFNFFRTRFQTPPIVFEPVFSVRYHIRNDTTATTTAACVGFIPRVRRGWRVTFRTYPYRVFDFVGGGERIVVAFDGLPFSQVNYCGGQLRDTLRVLP